MWDQSYDEALWLLLSVSFGLQLTPDHIHSRPAAGCLSCSSLSLSLSVPSDISSRSTRLH